MASTAERPTEPRAEREDPSGEMAPLIDRPLADEHTWATRCCDDKMTGNLFTGTAWLAQLSIFAMLTLVGIGVATHPIMLVTGHPISQTVGIFFIIQSILVLQPTRLAKQKTDGQRWHAVFHVLSLLSFVAGITIIEYNKKSNGLEHFHSVHAYIGVVTCGVLGFQYLFGLSMWAVPVLYGGEDNAKRMWKYHRWSGYLLLLLLLASVISATRTDYVLNVLKISTIGMSVLSAFILIGLLPRISLRKLGLRQDRPRQ